VEPAKQCPSCGSVTVDRTQARARLRDYLAREGGVGDEEAGRRADELMQLIGGGAAFGLGATSALASNWWLLLLRGGLAILFGVFALASPLAALTAFVFIFGVWAFIDGIDALALSLGGWRSWPMMVAGMVGIALGLVTFFRPGLTAFGLYAAIAAWAIARGILEIVVAIELRKTIRGELWLVLAGLASIAFGLLLVLLPVAGALTLGWLIGFYALLFGVLMVALSLRLRRVHAEIGRVERRPMATTTTTTPQPA
jgi:uncharacterized membrane protein HdeD (DUF308 family)